MPVEPENELLASSEELRQVATCSAPEINLDDLNAAAFISPFPSCSIS
jgi:hypothetical protein